MAPFPTIGIIGKRGDASAAQTLHRLVELLIRQAPGNGVRSVLVSDDSDIDLTATGDLDGVDIVPRDYLVRHAAMAIVVGGDGTLLSAARSLVNYEVPILGINHGRLGFLVEVSPDEIATAIGAVFRGQYYIAERFVLAVEIRHADGSVTPPALAINDVVLRNRASIRMIEYETWLSRDPQRPTGAQWEFISRHRADGLIISTPTGSTAYALSGGGPILHPGLSAVALVPICPHALTDRPIAVPASRAIRVVQCGTSEQGAYATCDGQVNFELAHDDAVELHRALHPLRLLHPAGYSYFRLLRDKLLWGRAPESTPSPPGNGS